MTDGGFHGLTGYGLRLTMDAGRPIPAKGFHGSWLRGVLGHALFRDVCIYDQPHCRNCALRRSCAYPQVFKPHLLDEQRLPPYLIHAWRVAERQCEADLVLIGPALAHAEAWIRGIHAHLGRLDLGGAGPGRLTRVRDLASRRDVFAHGAFRPGAILTPLTPPRPAAASLNLRLLTPLVSKHVNGDPLLGALRTRMQRLINDYGDGARLNLGRPPWRITQAHVKRMVVPRGDANPRQVAGIKGQLRLEDLTGPGADLLAVGAYFHAGGETSLGFGRFSWSH